MTTISLSRRALLASGAAFGLLAATGAEAQIADAAAKPFSFDLLSAEMQERAGQPYQSPGQVGGFLADLNYDDYRLINFRTDRQRWAAEPGSYRLAAFPMGWLFKEPVYLYEVVDGSAHKLRFTTDDFAYLNDLGARIPPMTELPGVAGFRLHAPLNRPDVYDELVAFIGASYFRALGVDSRYGISARGLALNTASSRGEEFPRFSRFYLDRSAAGGAIIVYAALESPSVTGAYRFVITPGRATVMEVTARLYFRQEVQELGVAPLTSMFLFSEKSRAKFDDFRPNVHDSDGLHILRDNGEAIWRPLSNPPRLSGSYFPEENPIRFGLHQRDRDFESYQDTEANYHRRPSLDVEPLGDWGKGFVRLVEIPSDLEANDNIVAYWVPEGPVKAGEHREFAYRLHWGDLPLDPTLDYGHVHETRAGHAGHVGVAINPSARKFVVDFKGGVLDRLAPDAEIQPVVTIDKASITNTTLQHIPENGVWRLVIDVSTTEDSVVEIAAHLAGYGRKLTENWLYQWIYAK